MNVWTKANGDEIDQRWDPDGKLPFHWLLSTLEKCMFWCAVGFYAVRSLNVCTTKYGKGVLSTVREHVLARKFLTHWTLGLGGRMTR